MLQGYSIPLARQLAVQANQLLAACRAVRLPEQLSLQFAVLQAQQVKAA